MTREKPFAKRLCFWKRSLATLIAAGFIAAAGFDFGGQARAEEPGLSMDFRSPGDATSVGTYFWVMNFSGSMTVDGQTIDMTGINLFDLLGQGELNFPPMIALIEWNRGHWGAYFDGTLVGINFGSGDVSLGSGPMTASFGMDYTFAMVNTGAKYTVATWETETYSNKFDLLAGLRYTFYNLDLKGSVGPTPVSKNETMQWVDGTIGARFIGQHSNGITYSALADLGLGAGFSAQALGTIGYTWKKDKFDLNAFAGYRGLYQDWSSGSNAVDLTSHGPLLGLKFVF